MGENVGDGAGGDRAVQGRSTPPKMKVWEDEYLDYTNKRVAKGKIAGKLFWLEEDEDNATAYISLFWGNNVSYNFCVKLLGWMKDYGLLTHDYKVAKIVLDGEYADVELTHSPTCEQNTCLLLRHYVSSPTL